MTKVLLDELFDDGIHGYGAQIICMIPTEYAKVGNILYFQNAQYPWEVIKVNTWEVPKVIADPNVGPCDISRMGSIIKCEEP